MNLFLSTGCFPQFLDFSGYYRFEFREGDPSQTDLRGILREVAWRVVCVGLNFVNKIENGCMDSIWADNMLRACRTAERRERS